jgi:2-amino-4-hydroxy-6-hydroxymethyldihydropteridine diphosphokinase
VVKTSYMYETVPMYVTDQPKFLNCVLKVTTTLDPYELLKVLKDIEKDLGRDFGQIRFGPRIVDLDILYFDNLEIESELLTIPHPRIKEREFVLRPLRE